MVSVKLVLFSVFVAYLSISLYNEPVPTGASQALRLKVIFFLYRQLHPLSLLVETLGLSTDEAFKKFVVNNGSRLLNLGHDGLTTEDTYFDGVPVRVYRPEASTGALPAMVFYHGGGWNFGNVESHDAVTGYFAKEAHMVVVSVDYRLSPKYSQKQGLEDCIAATKHFISSANKYKVDPGRVVVAGDSAGGNYAAAVSLYLRDQNFHPMPKIQLLIYPSVQIIDLQLPSYQQNAKGPFLTREEVLWFISYAQTGSKDNMKHFDSNAHVPRNVREEMSKGLLNVDKLPKELLYSPYKPPNYGDENMKLWNKKKEAFLDGYHYPLMAKDHSNLPETYIFTAQYDPLRDDGFLYAHKLRESGVKVTHYNCPYGWHGIINAVKKVDDSTEVMRQMATFLNKNL